MRRRPLAAAIFVIAGLLLLALLVGWSLRFRIASGMVERKLAEARVPASYRLTRIGPFRERMEDVRIGDAKAPDLVARRIDVDLGYGWGGPVVRALRMEGVRLRARLDQRGLSLGAIDRLMPRSAGGETKLPDLVLRLHGVQLALATPNGPIRAAIEGAGNPQLLFQGQAQIEAPELRLASCALSAVNANVKIAAVAGRPRADGLVRIGQTTCPAFRLGVGRSQIMLSSDKLFQKVGLQATLEGFGGQAGSARFANLRGPITASGRIGDLAATAHLSLQSLALPDAARRVAQSGAMLAGTPVGPTGRRAADALTRILAKADAIVDLTAALRGTRAAFHVRSAHLSDATGGHIRIAERSGLSWGPQGWRADADIETGGGALPTMMIQLRQTAPGAPLIGRARLADYRAGEALLGADAVRFTWDGRARFSTTLRIDGPISGGFVRELTVPVRGFATASGTVMVDQGCQPVRFGQLQLASFTFAGTSLSVCGQPIVARSSGALRIDASSGPVRLTGQTKSGALVVLRAARLRVTQAGFTAAGTDATLGPRDRQTHFAIADLSGQFNRAGVGGTFVRTLGAIANVPLNIADAGGTCGDC